MSEKYYIYRHYDESGALLYVGMTCDPIRRSQAHMGVSSWRDQVRRIEIKQEPSRGAAIAAEAAAILAERPRYNIPRDPTRNKKPEPSQDNGSPSEVVKKLLGVRALARHLNLTPGAVSQWRGSVPMRHYAKIIEFAKARRKRLTPTMLIRGLKQAA